MLPTHFVGTSRFAFNHCPCGFGFLANPGTNGRADMSADIKITKHKNVYGEMPACVLDKMAKLKKSAPAPTSSTPQPSTKKPEQAQSQSSTPSSSKSAVGNGGRAAVSVLLPPGKGCVGKGKGGGRGVGPKNVLGKPPIRAAKRVGGGRP